MYILTQISFLIRVAKAATLEIFETTLGYHKIQIHTSSCKSDNYRSTEGYVRMTLVFV